MCLTRPSEKKIANTNIFCWKRLDNRGRSIIQEHQYKIGVTQPLVELTLRHGEVEQGYHSWVNEPVRSKWAYEKTYLCVIPKGTIYYTGLENDNEEGYVSETLVVLGPTQYGFFGKIGTELRRQKYTNQK